MSGGSTFLQVTFRNSCVEYVSQVIANARQSLRRCCQNYNRASFEMVSQYIKKGIPREQLLQKWLANPNVAAVTVEIIHGEKFTESCPWNIYGVSSLCKCLTCIFWLWRLAVSLGPVAARDAEDGIGDQ